MKKLISYSFILVFNSLLARACHSAEDGGDDEEFLKRRKRSLPDDIDVTRTTVLRNYFSNCLKSEVGDIWDWNSVVDSTVLDSTWYQSSNASNCSPENGNDTAECWTDRLRTYLSPTSFLLETTMQCINQYSSDTAMGRAPSSADIFEQGLASNPFVNLELCLEEDDEPFYPNSPQVRQYSACLSNAVDVPENRNAPDFPSIFQFIEGHTICSSEVSDCAMINSQPSGESGSPPKWPFRFEALTRSDSPLRSMINTCNTRVFPRRTEWTAWSECSVTCGGGSRSRTRECSDPNCETSQTERCSQEFCPQCSISLVSRRRCGGPSISREACTQQGCCFDRNACYKAMDEESRQPFFRPTGSPGETGVAGGEDGFPGSRVNFQCNQAKVFRPCGGRRIFDSISCGRMLCCWNRRLRRCHPPSITIISIRTRCPNGFENPPACTDINDCNPTTCSNGGTCVDRILGTECICPFPYTGPNCNTIITNTDCTSLPTINNINPSLLTAHPPGQDVTYSCTTGFLISSTVTNRCDGVTGNWMIPAGSSLLPSCRQICFNPPPNFPPPLQGPTDSNSATPPYAEGDMVIYTCSNPSDTITNAISTCTNGDWDFNTNSITPTCQSPSDVDLNIVLLLDSTFIVDLNNCLAPGLPGSITTLPVATFPEYNAAKNFAISLGREWVSPTRSNIGVALAGGDDITTQPCIILSSYTDSAVTRETSIMQAALECDLTSLPLSVRCAENAFTNPATGFNPSIPLIYIIVKPNIPTTDIPGLISFLQNPLVQTTSGRIYSVSSARSGVDAANRNLIDNHIVREGSTNGIYLGNLFGEGLQTVLNNLRQHLQSFPPPVFAPSNPA